MSMLARHRGLVGAPGLLVAVLGILPSSLALGRPASGELWVARYGGKYSDEAKSVAVSPDGTRVFVTGDSNGGGSGDDYATSAYDEASGASLWERRYNGPANGSDEAYSIAVSPDGARVFVTGYSDSSTSYDYATLAYDAATGARLWLSRYNGLGNDYDYARAVAVSPDGDTVFVTGYSDGGAIGFDYATLAYDAATGHRLWARRYNGVGDDSDQAYSLAVSPDGSKVFVTGSSVGTTIYGDYATVAYDAATGDRVWVSHYDGPDKQGDVADSIAVSPGGSKVFVTGYSDGDVGSDYATAAYDAETGAQLWAMRYDGPDHEGDYAQAVVASSDGSKVFATGYSLQTGFTYDYATVAYDASSGSELWNQRYDGPRNDDIALSLAVPPDGSKVFVSGYSEGGPSDFDYTTVAYDAATGSDLGVRRFRKPGADVANAIAVSPDGSKVFVTGRGFGPRTNFDYVTVAYET